MPVAVRGTSFTRRAMRAAATLAGGMLCATLLAGCDSKAAFDEGSPARRTNGGEVAGRAETTAGKAPRRQEDDEQAKCARDTECVRAAAEVMSTYACMASFAASQRMAPQARDYKLRMVETVRVFQAMRIAQADWFAIQRMGTANAVPASKELARDPVPSEETISAVCYGAVLADPQFGKLVARATLR